jgi:hypothetical protein
MIKVPGIEILFMQDLTNFSDHIKILICMVSLRKLNKS